MNIASSSPAALAYDTSDRPYGERKQYLGLFFEPLSLDQGVVEFCICIANFSLVHKKLKPFSHALEASMPGSE